MTPADKDLKPKPTEREQKLAQALRSNLRRRKAGERPVESSPRDAKSGEET
jgi:hypothetical protein